MSGIAGIPPAKPLSPAQGSAAAGRIDPRLGGVVRHAAPAEPRLASDLSQAPHFPVKPLEARHASVVTEIPTLKG